MKKLNLLVVALTLIMGVSFTSCLNSNSDDTDSYAALAKLYSTYAGYSLKTSDGYTLYPTYASISSLEANGGDLSALVGDVVYVQYSLSDASVTDETSKTVTEVALNYLFSMNRPVEVIYGEASDNAANDSVANAAIYSMNYQGNNPQFIFDQSTVLLPIQHTVTTSHNYLTLVYYTDEPEDNGDVLRLHLRYAQKGNDIGYSTTSYDLATYNLSFYSYFFDLSYAFNVYMMQNGAPAWPTKVEIVAQQNEFSTSLDDASTVEKVYTVEYTE